MLQLYFPDIDIHIYCIYIDINIFYRCYRLLQLCYSYITVLLVVKLRSRDIHRKLHLGRGAGRAVKWSNSELNGIPMEPDTYLKCCNML